MEREIIFKIFWILVILIIVIFTPLFIWSLKRQNAQIAESTRLKEVVRKSDYNFFKLWKNFMGIDYFEYVRAFSRFLSVRRDLILLCPHYIIQSPDCQVSRKNFCEWFTNSFIL
jgi:hypothetical protein